MHFICRCAVAGFVFVAPGIVTEQTARSTTETGCEARHDLVGECFRVRGRISFYNGNPSFRLWWIGTKRLLGLDPDEEPMVSENVRQRLKGVYEGNDLFGEFIVCPVTREHAGVMQRVCIASADGLILRPR
jgi:hypothetical protein